VILVALIQLWWHDGDRLLNYLCYYIHTSCVF